MCIYIYIYIHYRIYPAGEDFEQMSTLKTEFSRFDSDANPCMMIMIIMIMIMQQLTNITTTTTTTTTTTNNNNDNHDSNNDDNNNTTRVYLYALCSICLLCRKSPWCKGNPSTIN